MSQLFSPYFIGSVTLPNRIVIAPMCQYSAVNGEANDWHLMHLGNLAMSGAGLLIIEATAVEPAGRISPADLGLWSDATEGALARVLQAIRQYSAMPIAIQLAHAGRKASTTAPWDGGGLVDAEHGGWPTVAPSALAFMPDDPAPTALDAAGLQRILQAFVSAAQRAHKLGIDAIEIHAAHGYLLHQFLSPLSNQRKDQYGGSLENRMRFPLAVFEAMRAAVPAEMPIGVRISATDWVDAGWDLAQSVAFSQALQACGCAFIHVSSGGLSPLQKIPVGPNYQVPLAASIRAETGLPTIAVGLITEAEDAEAIIADGKADMVGLARGILYDPRWPWRAAAKLGAQVEAPPQYWRCQPREQKALFGDIRFRQR
ncbi:NADH:flavin oxidoreductases, Old Yellow Enzyme family [Methylomonas albis]|uniref:NADH:flavin oxidoreductase/NADH oxidase n=1 Tax=Methylomonas albis TaxID=1854563 RepID=A0ABR9CZ54_9GAMM|nr:NADH:flavin oxidoreductase/NADH oxidase [Methylomonas albis]MBD9355253.1 NADH:flavin oxidoreductase/NADH oxidase [Methylomonas albis]CAD6878211.1 NADH:flavin oxidoreductases, Old Yellow Enzyme family [Methylomonas albis]